MIPDEVAVHNVLRAGVTDAPVNHGDFSVVAEVEPRGVIAEKTDPQRGNHLDTRRAQWRCVRRRKDRGLIPTASITTRGM